jgi:hypothetical protein
MAAILDVSHLTSRASPEGPKSRRDGFARLPWRIPSGLTEGAVDDLMRAQQTATIGLDTPRRNGFRRFGTSFPLYEPMTRRVVDSLAPVR